MLGICAQQYSLTQYSPTRTVFSYVDCQFWPCQVEILEGDIHTFGENPDFGRWIWEIRVPVNSTYTEAQSETIPSPLPLNTHRRIRLDSPCKRPMLKQPMRLLERSLQNNEKKMGAIDRPWIAMDIKGIRAFSSWGIPMLTQHSLNLPENLVHLECILVKIKASPVHLCPTL